MDSHIRKTILLVEDEILIALSEKTDLEKFGYQVIPIHSGEEAIELFKKNKDIDLILMDIDLGSGIDGTETAQIILKEQEIPILFLSSHTESDIVEKTEKITSYGYVLKNSSMTVLDASIKMAFKLFDAHTQLNQSNEKYYSIFENKGAATCTIDEKGIITTCNFKFVELSGYSKTEVEGKMKWADFCLKEDLERLTKYQNQRSVKTGNPPQQYDIRVVIKNNKFRWVTINIGMSGNERIVSLIDITDRKNTEALLNEKVLYLKNSEEKYHNLFNNMRSGCCIYDTKDGQDFILSDINNTGEKLDNLCKEDIVGKNISELFTDPFEKLNALSIFKKVWKTGKPHKFPLASYIVKDQLVWRENYVYKIPSGEIVAIYRDLTKQKNAEKALYTSEEKYRILFEGSDNAIIYYDINGKILLINKNASKIFGGKPTDFIDKNISDIIPPERVKLFKKRFNKIIKSGKKKIFEDKIKTQNNTKFYTTTMVPIKDINENVFGIQVISKDITEKKQIEAELYKFKSISDDSLVGIGIANLKGDLIYINNSFAQSHGYTPKELIGQNLSLFHNKDQMESVIKANQLLINQGSYNLTEIWHSHKDGSEFPMLMSGTLIHDNIQNQKYIAATAIDITKQKNIELILKENQEELQLIMQNTPDTILRIDKSGQITYVNKLIQGIPQEKIIGSSVFDWVPEEQYKIVKKGIVMAFKHRKPFEYEAPGTGHNNTLRNYSVRIMPIVIDDEIENAIYMLTDITDRKQSEMKINNLLKEKELLLKEVHHRIKNNMNVIKSILNMQNRTLKNPDLDAAFQDAVSRIESMGILYDKLYKSESYQVVSTKKYLSKLANEIFRIFPNWKIVKIKKQIDDFEIDTKVIFPIGIILNELITNSMKYAFPETEKGLINISITKDQNHVTFIFQDNGIGIPKVKLKNSKGFGLSLIEMLINQINGSLKISSDDGTKFIIEFEI